MRTCIGCRTTRSAAELLRLQCDAEGMVHFAPAYGGQGRGCHLCPRYDCLEAARKSRAFARAFRRALPSAATAGLAAELPMARAAWIAAFKPGQRTALIAARLESEFGVPRWQGPADLLDELINTVLSQSTNDRNRDLAFSRLKAAFPDWAAVSEADPAAIAAAIRPAGLANQKSVRIRDILRWIRAEYGGFALDHLCGEDPEAVSRVLTRLKGIGIKTVSVALMLCCGTDVFPVDTHVHRICQRLGLVPAGVSAEKTHALMQPLVPAGKSYALHMNFLRLGRTICQARKPLCGACPLALWCPTAPILPESE